MAFEEKDFKRRWRQLCKAFDIDPTEGASVYQVCLHNAGQGRQRTGTWWRDSDLWEERKGYDAGFDRPLEDEVFDGLWLETRQVPTELSTVERVAIDFGAEFTTALLKEVLRELRKDEPLKIKHERQAAREKARKPPRQMKHPGRKSSSKIGKLDFSGTGVR